MPISVARHSLMRQMNEIAVLTAVRQNGPISRRRIANILGLTKSTVTVAAQRLLNKNILMEVGSVSTGPGRPEVLLNINPAAGYIVGAEIDVGTYRILLFDLEARILREQVGAFEVDGPPSDALSTIARSVNLIRKELDRDRYWGFGLSVPGIVSPTGEVLYAPNIKWHHVPVRAFFVQLFGEPVFTMNEANAGAIGEYFFGGVQGSELLLYASLGMGIGGGIVVEGELLQGVSGAATEIGHMSIVPDGPLCRCGRRGCLETVASAQSLIARVENLGGDSFNANLDHILDAWANNDAKVIQAVDETMEYLEMGMINIANVFDPGSIVLGGPLATLGTYLRDRISTAVNQHVIGDGRHIAVQLSALGSHASAIGAGAMVLHTAVQSR